MKIKEKNPKTNNSNNSQSSLLRKHEGQDFEERSKKRIKEEKELMIPSRARGGRKNSPGTRQ